MKSDTLSNHPSEETTTASPGLWPLQWKTLKVLTRELSVRSRIADVFLTEPRDRMYAEVLRAVLDAMKSPRGIFCGTDERGDPVCLSSVGIGASDPKTSGDIGGFSPEDWTDLWRQASDGKRMLCSNGPVLSPRGSLPATRVLVAPIVFREACIGLFTVADKGADYDDQDALVMEAITQHVSPILKARLQRDAEEARRVEAEASLRESHAFLDGVIESMTDPILVIDPHEYSVIMANTAARRLAPGEGPTTCHSILFDRDVPCCEQGIPCALEHAKRSGKPATVETEHVFEDGRRRILEVRAHPMSGEHGSVSRVILAVRDITDRRREEEERHYFQERTFEAEKIESLAVLSSRIAHDFNNLLVGVFGNVDMAILEIPPESSLMSYVRGIRAAAVELAALNDQLMRFSGRGGSHFSPVNLSQLMDTLDKNRLLSVSKEAVVRMDLDASIPPIRAVETQIGLAVRNLVTNAAEAMGGGVISIRTGIVRADHSILSKLAFGENLREGEYVFIDVSDTGMGIEPGAVDRIFDPFCTTKPSGPGLGLAAVLWIVRGHGGGISVETEPRRGTTFRLLFPCLGPVVPSPEVSEARDQAAGGAGWILVVDDEETVLTVTRLILEHAGFRVLSARNGIDALDLLRNHIGSIACVLLDLTMPLMDGVETFERIRSLNSDLPVVLTTGYFEKASTGAFSGRNLSGFLRKPYSATTLVAKIRGIVDKR